jgi:hypothetical protein
VTVRLFIYLFFLNTFSLTLYLSTAFAGEKQSFKACLPVDPQAPLLTVDTSTTL